MKNVKFWDIPDIIKKAHPSINLSFDGSKNDYRIHSDEMFQWAASTKKEYTRLSKLIDKIDYKGNGWVVYGWYDVSGYNYWMKSQEETNYIQITISFDSENVPESEIENIYRAVDKALAVADGIEYSCSVAINELLKSYK